MSSEAPSAATHHPAHTSPGGVTWLVPPTSDEYWDFKQVSTPEESKGARPLLNVLTAHVEILKRCQSS